MEIIVFLSIVIAVVGCIDFHRSRSACKKTNSRNDRCAG